MKRSLVADRDGYESDEEFERRLELPGESRGERKSQFCDTEGELWIRG